MMLLRLTEEEVESLKSIVMSHNGRLRASGDWPEEKLNRVIETKIIDLSYQIYKKKKTGGKKMTPEELKDMLKKHVSIDITVIETSVLDATGSYTNMAEIENVEVLFDGYWLFNANIRERKIHD